MVKIVVYYDIIRRVAGVVEPTELEPQQAEMSHPFKSDTLFKSNMLKQGLHHLGPGL